MAGAFIMSSAPIPDRSLRITATTSSSRVSKSNETQIPASNSDESSGRVEVTHVFLELTSLDELSFPTSSSSRIKVFLPKIVLLLGFSPPLIVLTYERLLKGLLLLFFQLVIYNFNHLAVVLQMTFSIL